MRWIIHFLVLLMAATLWAGCTEPDDEYSQDGISSRPKPSPTPTGMNGVIK